MTIRVYYEEFDGEMLPMWILLPIRTSKEYEPYTIEAPFERFFPEDFHDELAIITVTQGALTRGATSYQFHIHIPTMKKDLIKGNHRAEMSEQSDYFLIRMGDLEELLQLDVRQIVNIKVN